MVSTEEIRQTVLHMAAKKGAESPFKITDVARSLNIDHWEDLIEQVQLVVSVLEKEGKIEIEPEGTITVRK